MKHPDKWRETIDPYVIPSSIFEIIEILGYPHAGNDVFHVKGISNNICYRAYIKFERQKGADICNEIRTILSIPYDFKPNIIAYSQEEPVYIITEESFGERLSTIVGDNENMLSLEYMKRYGNALAMIHELDVQCDAVKHRRFFDIPRKDYFEKHGLQFVEGFLHEASHEGHTECFVHGDFHYANILWNGMEISAVLDYELSGYGVREFDIAWAVFLRPSQKFLKTYNEIELFLEGYSQLQKFSRGAFYYYYVLIACHFYSLGDDAYKETVMRLINESIALYF